MKTDRTEFDNAIAEFVEEASDILLATTEELQELQATGGDTAEITEFQIKVNEALTAVNAIPVTEAEFDEELGEAESESTSGEPAADAAT